jgi:hypothetical protein
MVMRSAAQEAELPRIQRACAGRRHGNELKRALDRLEWIGFDVRVQLGREAEQQFCRAAACRNQTDTDFDQPHVQL